MSDYDEIRLIGVGGYGYHGVLAKEREEGQPFHVDLVLYLDTAEAARTDALGHTADYSAVAKAAVEVIEGDPVNLIETLAARIADAVLDFGVAKVDVTVHKPQAPLGVPFTDVQVHMSRTAPTGAATSSAGPGVEDLHVAQRSDDEAKRERGGSGAVLGQSPPAVPAVPPAPPPPAVPFAPLPAVPVHDLLADNEGIPARENGGDVGSLDATPEEAVALVLGIGGNLGDVRQTLREAVEELAKTDGIRVTDVSALARTAAVTHNDAVAQDDFLNAVVLAETTLSPRDVLAAVHRIEDSHGRVRVERWGDRTLDIDIITYGDVVASDADLTLPHLRASQRAFVLVPWAQVDPGAQLHGPDGGTVADLAELAPDRDGVRWLALDWLEEGKQQTDVAPSLPVPDPLLSEPEPPLSDREAPQKEAVPPPIEQGESPLPERVEESAAQEEADTPIPAEPVVDEPTPPVAPSLEEPPAVADWLPAEPESEPEYSQAQPAVPLPPPPATPGDSLPLEGEEEQQETAESTPAAVDWLADEEHTPPLSASPQWLKVRREE